MPMTTTTTTHTAHAVAVTYYTTDVAAQRLGLRPQTLRAAVCSAGHYGGVTPRKRGNRMLAWPADQIDRVAAGLPLMDGGVA